MSSLPPPSTGPSPSSYDAVLLVSFGGPERPEDVMPFLENVVRGKDVPRERLLAVAEHYDLFDGVSPVNAQNRALLTALIGELHAHGMELPVYWGNRNWHPMLADTVQAMADDGVRRALALVTSAFGSYPSCRQYLEDIANARQDVGPSAPRIDKLRLFFNHPGFIEATADRVAAALEEVPAERRSQAKLIYTAHSIPTTMAERSPYERQLREACRLVTDRVLAGSPSSLLKKGTGSERTSENSAKYSGREAPVPLLQQAASSFPEGSEKFADWQLVFQNRSGPSSQPWLGPNIADHIRHAHQSGELKNVVVVPIGFLAENMEVVYDLDVEIAELCDELGIHMVRAAVVGCHPRFVQMIRELIVERIDSASPRLALGADGRWPDECPADCCRRDLPA